MGSNDLSWYTRNPFLTQASATIPFPNRPGMRIPMRMTSGANTVMEYYGTGVIDWLPSFGSSSLNTDPASVAGKEIYAKVRAAFSGSLDADAPDYIIYLGALDSIFAYIAYLKRIYRLLVAWSPNNYVTPDGILESLNFSSAEIAALRANRTQLWQYINELVLQSRKFTCPAEMDLMRRHYWLSDNVYTDAPTINSQFYIFNMIGAYHYTPLPSIDSPDINAPGLQTYMLPNMNFTSTRDVTPDGLYKFGLSMIQKLVEWDDSYTINGYLKKAYDGAPLFIVEEIPADQSIEPIYNEEVLTQIENAKFLPSGNNILSGASSMLNTVQQNVSTNAISCTPQYKPTTMPANYNADSFLSLRSDLPSAGEVVIATRLSPTFTFEDDTIVVGGGTEIPVAFRLVAANNVFTTSNLTGWTGVVIPSLILDAATDDLQLSRLSWFSWHPIFPSFTGGSFNVYGDVHNFTVVSNDTLNNIHRVCVLSELNAYNY